jgi:hypothetical protein
MSCCGNRSREAATPSASTPPRPFLAPVGGVTMAIFRYEGRTSLTAYGPYTGRKYFFAGPGTEVAVDLRDRSGMQKVPNLRETRLA